MRFACADVGTNSARLLVAEAGDAVELRTLAHVQRTIRLGEGVDANGYIGEPAMDRLVETVEEFSCLAARHNVSRLIIAGTSASRDARNDLSRAVYERTGLRYEILSGTKEAEWSFRGAMSSVAHLEGHAITCDIGGGSTEFTLGHSHGKILSQCSLDMGSVRISERLFDGQPPAKRDIRRARELVRQSLAQCKWLSRVNAPMIGASDTHRILLQLTGKSSLALTRRDVDDWSDHLLTMTREEVRTLAPEHLTGRADIFPAAVLICRESMVHCGIDRLTVSRRGLVHGLVLRELSRQNGLRSNMAHPGAQVYDGHDA